MIFTFHAQDSICQQFERRITCGDRGKLFRRRAGGNRKVSLHFALEAIEVGFQNLRLLDFGNWAQMKFLAAASLLQCDFSGSFGVANPLRPSPWRDQVALTLQFQKIDRSGEELAGFASANLEKINMRRPQTEADEESEGAVEESFNGGGFAEGGERRVHAFIVMRNKGFSE